MANVTFDAVGGGASGSNTTSLSWSHVSGGVNRAISVGVASSSTLGDSTAQTVTACDVGGQALTLVQSLQEAAGFNRSTQLQRVGQNSGTATVTVTFSAAAGTRTVSGSSISANNVDQSTPIVSGHNGTNGGNSISPTVTITTATEELLVDCLSEGDGGTDTAGTNQTKRFESNPGSNGNSSLSTKDGVNGGTMSWTIALSDVWALCAFAWAPVTASTTGPTVGSYRSTNPLILRNPLFSLMASYQGLTPIVVLAPAKEASDRSPYFVPGGLVNQKYLLRIATVQGPTPIVVPVPAKEASDRAPYFAPGGLVNQKYLLQIATVQGPTPIVVLVPSKEASDRAPYFAPGGRINPRSLQLVTIQGQTPIVVLVPSKEASDRAPYFAPGGLFNQKYLLQIATVQGQTPTVVASVVSVFFRKTLSLVGTRTGSRQSHNT